MCFTDSILRSFQHSIVNEKSEATFQDFFCNYFYFKSYNHDANKIKYFLEKQDYFIKEIEKVFRFDLEGADYHSLINQKINNEQYYVMKNINLEFTNYYNMLFDNGYEIDVKDEIRLGKTFDSAYFRGKHFLNSFILSRMNENDSKETKKIYEFARNKYGNEVNVYEKKYHEKSLSNYNNIEIIKKAKEILKYINTLSEKEINLGIVVIDQDFSSKYKPTNYLLKKERDKYGKLTFYFGVEEQGMKISKFEHQRLKIDKSCTNKKILNQLIKILRKNICVIDDHFNFIELIDKNMYQKLLDSHKLHFNSL